MSAGSLTGGVLSLKKLVIGGSTFTGGSGVSGLTTTPATGTTTANPIPFTVGAITNTTAANSLAFTASAGSMSLGGNIQSSGAGGGTTVPTLWSNTAAYSAGAVVSVGSLLSPTGTFICITPVAAPTPPATNTAPAATAASWTPVAPLASSGAVSALRGGGATPTDAVGNIVFTSTVASGATTALTWTSSAAGMELGGTVAGSGGGGTTVPTLWSNSAAYAVGAVVSVGSLASPTGTFICITAVAAATPPATNPAPAATAASWTPVAPLASAGSGIAIARGVLVMNGQGSGGAGTVGVLSGTPTAGQVQLVALSGTLPASVGANNTWSLTWGVGEDTASPPNPVSPPAQAPFAPLPPSGTSTATTVVFNCVGGIIAGARLNWVLY